MCIRDRQKAASAKPEEKYPEIEKKEEITIDDFEKIQIQVGEVLECKPVEKAKKPVSYTHLFGQMKNEAVKLMKYIDDMEIYEIIGAIKNITNYKAAIEDYLDMILLWYRDVLMFKVTLEADMPVSYTHLG